MEPFIAHSPVSILPMQYFLAYGRGTLAVELPDKNVVKVFQIKSVERAVDSTGEIDAMLQRPIASRPLAEIARGKCSACVVVSDITRPVPNQALLPPILATLEASGISRENILILVATGLHRASTVEEKLEMFGRHIVQHYRVEDHDARNREEHDFLGDTPRGIPVWIDRRYLQAELKILTGLIEPHLMAGFSGGRKSICPGIAGVETISAWHTPKFLEHDNAKFGCVDGNPVHEEQMLVAKKAGCDFIVNVVIDHLRNILHVVAGDMDQAHREGVRLAREVVGDTLPEAVDIVVTGAAGYPLDKTLYQSIKGVVGAMDILKPGGTIILASSCDEGLGSVEFEEIARKFATIDEFLDAIFSEKFFIVNQWQIEELGKALKKGRVRVVSEGMASEELHKYYVEPAESVERAVEEALARYGSDATIAVMPDGPYVLAELKRE